MKVPTESWPVISMVTTHVNQDTCEGVVLTLHYSASVATTGSVTKATTGTGSGSQSGSGSSVPVKTATASSGGALAFTGLDIALFVGVGGLLLPPHGDWASLLDATVKRPALTRPTAERPAMT